MLTVITELELSKDLDSSSETITCFRKWLVYHKTIFDFGIIVCNKSDLTPVMNKYLSEVVKSECPTWKLVDSLELKGSNPNRPIDPESLTIGWKIKLKITEYMSPKIRNLLEWYYGDSTYYLRLNVIKSFDEKSNSFVCIHNDFISQPNRIYEEDISPEDCCITVN